MGMNYSLTNARSKAQLRWSLEDGVEGVIYKHSDGVRIDFSKTTPKKSMVISLKSSQYMTLYHISDMINTCVRKKKHFSYDLGEKIYVTHEEFWGKWSVNIRQYYTDDRGDQQPGKWGVHLNGEMWKHTCQEQLQEMCKLIFIYS